MAIRIGTDLLSLIGDKSSPTATDNVYYDKTNKKLKTSISTIDLDQQRRLIPKTTTFSTDYALHPGTWSVNPNWQKLTTEVSIDMTGANGYTINEVKAIKLDQCLYQIYGRVTGYTNPNYAAQKINFATLTQIEGVTMKAKQGLYPTHGTGEWFYADGLTPNSGVCIVDNTGACYFLLNSVEGQLRSKTNITWRFSFFVPFSATGQYNGKSL